jgi:FKBP12-rapamycin complex-associated protein
MKDTLSKKRAMSLELAVFVCFTMLGHAVKLMIRSDVQDLLEPMLATALNTALTTALKELVLSVPQLKEEISEGNKMCT